ncbi:MAG: extracellular solute-binding protein [Prevotella sp.]|nr:extracellular solute-binding protein [Prevotella sp.]
MKKKLLAALLTASMVATMLVGCGGSAEEAAPSTDAAQTETKTEETKNETAETAPAEKQDVTLRMWGAEEDQEMLQGMIDSFVANYADAANITVELGVESESTAKDIVLTDIEAAADVFAFASDQLPDLVKAGALQNIDELDAAIQAYAGKSVADIKGANAPGSVDAATANDALYAFPMSADNGYFLYYDSSVISADDAKSWDSLLAATEAAGKKVGMTFASGWYNASFFYGAGFTTGLNEDGTTSLDFNGTADYSGVEVVKGMLNIAGHPAFMAIADGDISNQIAGGSLAAVVSGTWDATAAQTAFGDGYAATKLPTYTIGDAQVQQGSVAGFKLVGVNAYSQNAGWAALLAEWITNEENQKIRFATREIGPSNINAAASEEVAANIAISALAEQSAYGVVQVVGGNYWDPTATFGEMIAKGELSADDEAGIQTALDNMVAGVTAPVQ